MQKFPLKNSVHRCKNEKGSALFFVLIAVALFAALSYTVADMMRGGDPSQITEERARLFAGEILDQGRKIRATVQDLRISNGCTDTTISFENNGNYVNGAAGPECEVFNTVGGGLNYVSPPADWFDAGQSSEALYGELYFPANLCVEDVGTGAAGCESDSLDNEDLVMIIPYINQQICEEVNEALGLGTTIPVETSNGWPSANPQFTGSYADGTANEGILDQGGRQAGCFEGSGANNPPSGTYHFFQVLKPR